MALVKSEILKTIAGKVASIDFRTRRNGKIEVAATRDPTTTPKTSEQQEANQIYGNAVQTWRTATDTQREEWTAEGAKENISGFNILIRESFAAPPARYGAAKYGTDKYS